MKRPVIYILFFVIASIGLTACGSGRRAAVPAVGDTMPSVKTENLIPTDNNAVNRLLASYKDGWTNVRVPVNVALKSPRSMSVSGRLTVVNGMGLTLSVRALGFEVASLTVLGDSIYACEKLGKRCVAESVKSLVADLGVSTDEAVKLVMGHLFMFDESSLVVADDSHLMLTPARDGVVQYGWTLIVDNNGAVSPEAFVVEVDKRVGVVGYSDFVASAAGPVAGKLELQAATGKMVLTATVTLDYNKAEWNGNFKVERPSMKGYRRVAGGELLQMFKTLM